MQPAKRVDPLISPQNRVEPRRRLPEGGEKEPGRSGVTIGRTGYAMADHFINLYKGWRRETDQFAIWSTKART